MKVHIVCYEDVHGWILGKFALKLQEHLHPLDVHATISKQPDPKADINHHIIYFDYDGRKTTTETIMVTHIDTDWKRERLRSQLAQAPMGICMSAETVDQLAAAGLPRHKLCFINPGHDGEMSPRRTVVGITSKVQPSGCKRERILLDLIAKISPDEFEFRIMGAGWDQHVHQMRQAGFRVDYWKAFDRPEYLKLMPTLDYYLYLGLDEGSMGFMDALTAGVQTIITAQGYHLDAAAGITHGWKEPAELFRIFETIARDKRTRRQAVADWTWPEYAKRHFMLWNYLLAKKAHQTIPVSLRTQLQKMAVIVEHSDFTTSTTPTTPTHSSIPAHTPSPNLLSRELLMPSSIVDPILDHHGVHPWFKHTLRDRATRWESWRTCFWLAERLSKDTPILELGCGVGLSLFWFAEQGFSALDGQDLTPENAAAAREIAAKTNHRVRFWVDDALEPRQPSDRQYGAILALNFTHCAQGNFSLSRFLTAYESHLLPGGFLVFDAIDPSYDQIADSQFHTADVTLPREQRRPSEYINRLARADVETACKARGFEITHTVTEPQRVPKVLYFLRRLPVSTTQPAEHLLSPNLTQVVRDGVHYALDLTQYIDRSIHDQGCFEPDTTAALDRLAKPGMIVLDIGANIGAHTFRLARRVGPSGHVHAVEPMSWAFSKLQRNHLENPDLSQVSLHHIALGDCSGTLNADFNCSWPVDQNYPQVIPEPVPVCRLDDFVLQHHLVRVDLIKLDVDGFEHKILRGAIRTLRNLRPILVMELCHYTLERVGDRVDAMMDDLASLGYRFFFEKDFNPATRDELLHAIPQGSSINIIAVHALQSEFAPPTESASAWAHGRKPRIMLMADVPNWIFARHCKVLMDRLGDQFEFDLKFQGQSYREEDYDLLFPLEWNLIPMSEIRTPAKYITGIRSHTSWHGHDFLSFAEFLSTHFQQIHTVSKRLTNIFSPFVPNTRQLTHGTNTTFFSPTTRADFSGPGRLRIGWAGNRVNNTKGFEEFIAPLAKLPGVELVFCGYLDKNLDLAGMHRFYDSIEVYVCSSQKEGNNNSLMEAAAMERAIVTTDNGTVPEYLVNDESALIVERELAAFIHAVCKLRDDPSLRLRLGRQARDAVKSRFDWDLMLRQHAKLLWDALDQSKTWQPPQGAIANAVAPQRHKTPTSNTPVDASPKSRPDEAASAALFNQTGTQPEDPLQRAEREARSALESNPNDPTILKVLATVLFQRRRWLDCARFCHQLLSLAPNDTDVMVVLAESLVQLSDIPTAIEIYRELQQRAPNDPDILSRLQELSSAPTASLSHGSDAPTLNAEQERLISLGIKELETDHHASALEFYIQAQAAGPAHPDLEHLISQLREFVTTTSPSKPATTTPSSRETQPPVARADRLPGWSFLIITNGKRPEKLRREIESIQALNIPSVEILVGGEPPTDLPDIVGTVPAVDAARNGRLGEMRNALTRVAKYDHLVVVDDDFLFHDDFFAGLIRFGDDWNVLSVRILNPDGTRFWDWATHGGPRGHILLDYDEDDDHVYVTGGLILLKAHVAYTVQWNDGLGFYQGEDLDFASRLRVAGFRPKFNRYSTTTHDDASYTVIQAPCGLQIQRRPSMLGLPVRWAAPIFNPSGYASEAINFVLPLESKCNLGILHHTPVRSQNFINGLPPQERESLLRMAELYPSLKGGIVVSHNPANGFVRLPDADYSIGRTMFETDRISPDWVFACNRMDEVWVPSKFNVESFASSGVERSKLVVIPGAVDEVFFDPAKHSPYPLPNRASFNFLSLFEWSSRKGWDVMLAAYLREFSAADDVCLWLRTYLFSKPDGDPTEAIRRRIATFTRELNLGDKPLPRIELIAEQVPNAQLPSLYLACDCYLAPSRGEGWGRPQHEAMLMERPVIATNWSANTEFMTDENSYLLDYELVEARGLEPELWHYKGHRWANPSEPHLRTLMRHVFSHRDEAQSKGRLARKHMALHYGRAAVSEIVLRRLQIVERRLRSPSLPTAEIQHLHQSAPAPAAKPVAVSIEGSFLDLGSLSLVNRALVKHLGKQPGFTVAAVSPDPAPKGPLAPESKIFAARVLRQLPAQTAVTISHQWPPRWKRPSQGAWIVMQPWEFGSLPAEWVKACVDVDAIWCYSRYVRSLYVNAGVPPTKLKVLPLGFDPDTHKPDASPYPLPTSKGFKFLFVGGTIGRKGADALLAAYLKTFTNSDDVCLVIKDFGGKSVYSGQTLAASIQEAQANPNAPEIVYIDAELSAQELAGLYTACDCLVHPYRGEGFGLPVLEAMACACPVIATGGGATDDFATDEFVHRIPATRIGLGHEVSDIQLDHRGWWLEPDPESLRHALRIAIRDRITWRERALRGAQFVASHWTWKHSASTAAALLHDLLNQRALDSEKLKARNNPSTVTFKAPDMVNVGSLTPAAALLNQGNHSEAWQAGVDAIQARPFHPEAWLLLAEIALQSSRFNLARRCAQQAIALAPQWKPAKKFLPSVPTRGESDALDWTAPPFPNPLAPRLSVCLITKNEARFLPACLSSIKDIASEIIIVDTGSSDNTVDIARRFGAEVHHLPWADDFSLPRNEALRWAKGDWILMLDADEVLSEDARSKIQTEMTQPGVIAYRLPIIDVGREDHGRSFVPRLFRNAPGLFYVGRIHEQIYSSLEVRRQQWGLQNQFGHSTIRHFGYSPEIIKDREKLARNLRLLEKAIEELPDDPNLLMNMGLELTKAGQATEGINHYLDALKALTALPKDHWVPELRETLLSQLSTHLLGEKRFDEIPLLFKHRLALAAPLTATMHFTLGLALMELKRPKEAADEFRACIKKRNDPTLSIINPEIHKAGPSHCLALCLISLGKDAEAAKAFEQALADAPTSKKARFDHARFLMHSKNPVGALNALHQLVQEDPKDIQSWILGAEIALSNVSFAEVAYDWTTAALESHPNQTQINLLAAEAALLHQDLSKATSLFQRFQIPGNPRHQAALILCAVATNSSTQLTPPTNEPAVSREFIQWFRKLIDYKANAVLEKIPDNMALLHRFLPTSANALEEAFATH